MVCYDFTASVLDVVTDYFVRPPDSDWCQKKSNVLELLKRKNVLMKNLNFTKL